MQSERPLLPEFNLLRRDAIAYPVWRSRHGTDGELRGKARNRLLNANRLSSAVDCLLAQAPICAIREREAK